MPGTKQPALNFDEVMAELRAAAGEGTRTVLLRYSPAARILGVKYGDLARIAKRIKRQSPLAGRLWETGWLEARTLAVRAMDPAALTPEQADRWVSQVDFPALADELAALVYRTPFAADKLTAWTASPADYVRRAGYGLLYRFAADQGSGISEATLRDYLERIETEIHGSPNWSREMMNMVPVAIGKTHAALFPAALACARAFSPVAVFHGEKTNCKVRYAVDDLLDPKVRVRI